MNLGTTRVVIVRSTDRERAPKQEVECPQPQMPEMIDRSVPEKEPYSVFEELLEQEQYGLVAVAPEIPRGNHAFCPFCGSPLTSAPS